MNAQKRLALCAGVMSFCSFVSAFILCSLHSEIREIRVAAIALIWLITKNFIGVTQDSLSK